MAHFKEVEKFCNSSLQPESQTVKCISNKNTARDITLSNFKTHYKAKAFESLVVIQRETNRSKKQNTEIRSQPIQI
jgi:hypothetical protein